LLRLSPVTGEATRALNVRLQAKVYGGIESQKLIVPPKSGTGSPAPGLERLAEQVSESGESVPAAQPTAANDPFGTQAFESPPAESRGPGARAPMIDKRKLSDPRLRAHLGVDLAAFTRCVEAGDHRLATVLLASILEAALLDHAIPRRAELGLTGTPETWNMQDVLLRALGPEAQVKDPALAFHLFTSRNLMRPALQMITPTIVTAASLARLREFAERVLHSLGFGRTPEMLSADEFGAFDLPSPSFDD
jgi:hypothetical protein